MANRDPRRNSEDYEQRILEAEESIADLPGLLERRKAELPPWKVASITLRNGCYSELLILMNRYKRGDALEDLRGLFPRIVSGLEVAEEKARAIPDNPSPALVFQQGYTDMLNTYQILAFGLCLNVDKAILNRLFDLIPAGEDRLIDRIIANYRPERPVADKLVFPKNYQVLYDAIDAPVDKQSGLLKKRLKLYEKHDFSEYSPLWDFPLVSVIKSFKLEDDWLKDNTHYPWELVHWQES